MPCGEARDAFHAWCRGARPLAAFLPRAWREATHTAAHLASVSWEATEASLRAEYADTGARRVPIYPPFHLLFGALDAVPSPAAVRVVWLGGAPSPWGGADGLAWSQHGGRLGDALANILAVRAQWRADVETDEAKAKAKDDEDMPAVKRARGEEEGGSTATAAATATATAATATAKTVAKPTEADRAVAGGDLRPWARQGVLLLNMCLTSRHGDAAAHKDTMGWSALVDALCADALAASPAVVCLLTGKAAADALATRAADAGAFVVALSHPSSKTWREPSSARARTFCWGKPFHVVNDLLALRGVPAIKW